MKLYRLKTKLNTLSIQFKQVLSCFAVPLTAINMANIFIMIGISCFLMVSEYKGKEFFFVIMFNMGIYAFSRLIIICYAGNLASIEYRELIRQIYELLQKPSLGGWMCFGEIKAMRGKFKATLLDTYTLRQSSILSCLAFGLNYVIVLLQTENYGSSQHHDNNDSNKTIEQ